MSDLWRWGPDTRSAMSRALFLSIVIELVALLSPYFMQLVMDQVILQGDRDLLKVLALAFALVALFNVLASSLRSLVMQFFANIVSHDMGARLLHHMLSLPLGYFHKRKLGDLLQRFGSLQPITNFIVAGGITTLIDGALASVTLVLMLLYSRLLALLVVAAVCCYLVIRIVARTVARAYASDAMVADAKVQTQFLETIRAIQTIKANGGERPREVEWLNLYVSKLNSMIRIGNLGIAYQAVNGVITSLSEIIIIYIAAREVIASRITIGIMVAFLAYKAQFMTRLMSFADQLIAYRMLDVQLARIADIALTVPEETIGESVWNEVRPRGEFKLKGLTYRYAARERPVLNDATATIKAGEFVVITGVSGSGKSTLLKVLVGLYSPESGEVMIDGKRIQEFGIDRLRGCLGIVTQDDHLLTGTLAENIALFDRTPDMARIRECGRAAQIDDEVMALPMQYYTLVGDLGTALSAGQRQRVLIARALYRAPQVLIFDEATVHVGQDCERELIAFIKELRVTRIVATHSQALIEAADRVLHLEDGRLADEGVSRSIDIPNSVPAGYETGVV